VFADTLSAKIILPKRTSGTGVPSRFFNGMEENLGQGMPIGIRAKSNLTRPRRAKVKEM
jgi:hypothetical protein